MGIKAISIYRQQFLYITTDHYAAKYLSYPGKCFFFPCLNDRRLNVSLSPFPAHIMFDRYLYVFGIDYGNNALNTERNYYIFRLDLIDEEAGWEIIGKYKFLYDENIHLVDFKYKDDKMNKFWHGFYAFHSIDRLIYIFPPRGSKCGYMKVEKSKNLNANSKIWNGRVYYEFEKEKNKTIFKYINLKTYKTEEFFKKLRKEKRQSKINQNSRIPRKSKKI